MKSAEVELVLRHTWHCPASLAGPNSHRTFSFKPEVPANYSIHLPVMTALTFPSLLRQRALNIHHTEVPSPA